MALSRCAGSQGSDRQCRRCEWRRRVERKPASGRVCTGLEGNGYMRAPGVAVLIAVLACGLKTQAGTGDEVQLAQPDPHAAYIQDPVWAKSAARVDLAPFQPERAHRAGVTGGAVVDCAAKDDGSLIDCKTLKVLPAGWQFEIAGPVAAARLFKLKPVLEDGRPVSGMRVIVPVIWK